MCRLSVIIPIFNTGAFLKKCVNSVQNQTIKDVEIILVDDGSTDESGTICDGIAADDSRITVIHKENEGVSIARNIGIKAAKGEYIGFVDSDDWIDFEMYDNLYRKAKETNAEIVMCDAVTKYDDKNDEADTITQLSSDCLIEKEDISSSVLMELAGSAWRCIYKREILVKNDIVFPEGLKFSEDRIFNILAIGHCKRFAYIKKAYYNRYVRKGSAVSKYYENMIDIVLDARKRTMQAIDRAWDGDQEYKNMYENQTVVLALAVVNNEFLKDSQGNLHSKYFNVRRLCKNPTIRKSIKLTHCADIRAKLIIHKMCILLCIMSVLVNRKYGR